MRRMSILTASALALSVSVLGALATAGASAAASDTTGQGVPAGAPRYKVVKLGVLAGDEYSVPFGINARGDVVGYSGGQTMHPMPFVYTDAKGMRPLRMTGHRDVRDGPRHQRRQVSRPATSPTRRPAPRRPDGGRTVRSSCSARSARPWRTRAMGTASTTTARSAAGRTSRSRCSSGQEAFRFTDANGMESVTPGARPACGWDINDAGDVSGEYEYDAFRTDGDEILDISSGLAGNTTGEAINASGQVAITQTRPDLNDAWRWSPGTGLTDLGLAATDAEVFAHGINSAGDVVGRGRPVSSPNVAGGYLFRDGLGSIDLNELLLPRFRHWYISEAWDINDSGQIAAFATNLRNGAWAGFRLDPKP